MKRSLLFLVILTVVSALALAQDDPVVLVRTHGTLGRSDSSYMGEAVDWFEVRAPEDGRLEVVVVSVDMPPLIVFERPGAVAEEISGGRESARMTRSVEWGETVTVGVSTAGGSWSGPMGDPEYTVRIQLLPGAATLSVGGYTTGYLEPGDEMDGGHYIDWYPLPVTAGSRLTVELSSDDFDTYLIIESPDGNYYTNDDSIGTDSAYSFTPQSGGTALVGARSYYSDATGEYEISVTEVQVHSILVGETATGNLRTDSDYYTLQGQPGQLVDINLSSDYMDTTLTIEDPSGGYDYDDDGGDSSNSYLLYVIGESGMATITVSSFGSRGEYTLSVMESQLRVNNFEDGHELFDGDIVRGLITVNSPVHGGSYGQRFTFYAEEGDRVLISLESSAFDTYLRVVDSSGREQTDDDGGDGLNSLLDYAVGNSGWHDIFATPLSSTQTGLYTLSLTMMAPARTILSTRGQLTPRDSIGDHGKAYDLYVFDATAGIPVTIDVGSVSFDTKITLRDSWGTIIDENDDGGSGSDSRIIFVPDNTGSYEVEVTSFSSGAYGNYTVEVFE